MVHEFIQILDLQSIHIASFIMNISLIKSLKASAFYPFQHLRTSLYPFSKKKPSAPIGSNYHQNSQHLRKSIPKSEPQEPAPIKAQPLKNQRFEDDKYLRKLIMTNAIMAGAIPFWAPVNAGIVILNSGFILSQVARQIKQYLLLINNEHYQQLGEFKKPQQYLKIIMNNMLFMSVNCIFLSFGFYTSAHLGVLAWYVFNVLSEFLPIHYWIMVFPILTVILFNHLGNAILTEIFPSEMKIIQSLQEKNEK